MRYGGRMVQGATLVCSLAGCSVAGTWKTVSVEPKGVEGVFPYTTVTFDEHHMTYTAISSSDQGSVYARGKYDWTGSNLTLVPEHEPERTFQGALWYGRRLVLKRVEGESRMSATLERQAVPKD